MRVKSNNVDEIALRTAKPNDTQFKEWVICRETRASSWQLPFEKHRAPHLVRRSGALWYMTYSLQSKWILVPTLVS